MGCICGKPSENGSPIGHTPRKESSFSPSKPYCSKPSTTESPRKSSTGRCGSLSAGKPKFGPCGRFLRKTQLQLAARISKLFGHTIATISNGGSVPKFCINQVIPAVLSDREMAIAEATKGRGLCGKLNKVVLMDSGGLGTSVIVPWLSKPSTTKSPRKSSTGRCGPLSAGKLKFGPCIRFLRKTQLQLAPRISKLVGHTIATINIGGSVTKFCINQVIPAVLQRDREMAIAEATKGRGLCGKLNKVVLTDSGGLGTSVIVPWLSRENNGCDVGQGIGELEGLEMKAKASDASQLVVKDLKEEFVRNSIFLCSRALAIYERKYLLGNSMAHPVIEKGDILDPANKPKKDMNMLTLDPEEALETPEYIEVGIELGLPVSVMVH